MRVAAALGVVATLALLLAAPLAPAVPAEGSIPAGSYAPTTYASPYEAAYFAAQQFLTPEGLIAERLGGSGLLVRDQMLGVLLSLHRKELFPADSSSLVSQAQSLWEATQTAFHETSKFYDVTLTTPAECINVEPLVWAILAAIALHQETQQEEVRIRADEIAETLRSVLTAGSANGVEGCFLRDAVALPSSQAPLSLWALLEHARWFGSSESRRVAIDRLRHDVETRFDGPVFAEGGGLFLIEPNAQYLLVLQNASTFDAAGRAEFASARDDLAEFLISHGLRESNGGLLAENLIMSDPPQIPPGSTPEVRGQIWTAFALHRQRLISNTSSPDAPERLLHALVSQYWRTDLGGFSGADASELLHHPNALIALLTGGPRATAVANEGSRIAIALPQRRSFIFPPPDSAAARPHLLSNEWAIRFAVEGRPPFPQKVAIPVDVLGQPFNLSHAPSPFTPLPRAEQAGQDTGLTLRPGDHALFEFTAQSPATGGFRLIAYAPLLPVSSEIGREIRIDFASNGPRPFLVDALTIDLDIQQNVSLSSVWFNDQVVPLAPPFNSLDPVGATIFLDRPHHRLTIPGLTFGTRSTDTLTIQYADPDRPFPIDASTVQISLQSDGRSPTQPSKENGRLQFELKSANQWIRVPAADNAMLRRVYLDFTQTNLDDVELAEDSAQPGIWKAQLPALPQNEVLSARIRAVDEHDNLRDGEEFDIQYRSGFLREGDVILLAFATTLFFAAAAIYVKMGRRKVP